MDVWKKHGADARVMWGRNMPSKDLVSTQGKTQDELTAEAFAKPATGDCIMAHLTRLTAHLHLKGAGKDDDGLQSTFLIADYTDRLLEKKTREVDLFLACEHFIENNDDGFFPTIAKLLKRVEMEAK